MANLSQYMVCDTNADNFKATVGNILFKIMVATGIRDENQVICVPRNMTIKDVIPSRRDRWKVCLTMRDIKEMVSILEDSLMDFE